jgi:hypothetical protein
MSITSTKTQELKFHPLANLFPLMEGTEFDELVTDIKAHGQHARIVLKDGMILDGRNRACLAAGIEPMFACEAYSNQVTDPVAYVISANIKRRHLTTEQRRELIAKLIKAAPEKSNRQIASAAHVDHKTVAAVRAEKRSTGEIPQLKKTVGKDGKARRQRTCKPRPGAAGAATPDREAAARAQQDSGPSSIGEVERLRARVDELQAELRLREIKITGLKSEVAELKAENAALRAKLEARRKGAPDPVQNAPPAVPFPTRCNGPDLEKSAAGEIAARGALDDGSDAGPIPACLRRSP